tara:strand:+ start:161 stop:1549 length:1389 start_codon:yes stop_codon:yes gene_type:complete
MAGASTELYSEVLAQICLSYSIKYNSALTKDVLMKGKTMDPKIVKDIERYMITQSSVNLSSPRFTDGFIKYISGNVSGKLNWIDAQGRNMQEVKKRFKISTKHKIFNDKLFDSRSSANNPYTAFLKAGTGAKTDKWNPADIWAMNLDGIRALNKLNKRVMSRSKISLEYCNQFLADQFSRGNIIPISLKKPQKTPHIEIVNSNEFVSRISLNETRNATIEYDYGNKDVKINFTIETVQLSKGQKASTARRNPSSINGKVVNGSQKHIRLKYHVDNKKIELEYTQSGYPSRAAAKMGNLGATNFQKIINDTAKSGVSKLNQIQSNYNDIDVKTNPWFNGRQLGVTKARNEKSKITPHMDRIAEYVGDMWKEINGTVFDSSEKSMRDESAIWSKARAGELGVAISAIPNEKVKKRVIQNLYEAAASISYVTGLNKEEMELERGVGMEPSARKTNFNASVYVKVF